MVSIARSLGLAGILSITAGATASFDLLLQSDFDSNLGAHIDRYDPVSRVYLGSFAINSTPNHLTASHANGRVYAVTNNRVDEFDYSTGAMVRSFSVAAGVRDIRVSDNGSTLFVLLQNAYRTYNLGNLATSMTMLSGTTNASAFEILPNGNVIVADSGTQSWRLYDGATPLTSTAFIGHVNLNTLTLRPDSTTSTISVRGSDGGISLRGLTINGSSIAAQQTNVSNVNNTTGTTMAHQGMYAIGVSTATPTQLRAQYVLPGGLSGYGFNLSQTTSITGKSAIVLAPEPGTMIALGLGAAALLRRRRQK